MKAQLKNYRQSPRKVRLVASLLRGKSVAEARDLLSSVAKSATLPLGKLVSSAVANAVHNGKAAESDLFIKDIRVDGGKTLKRFTPRARGSASQILKRTSHVTLVLGERSKGKGKSSEVKITSQKSSV